MIDPPDILTRDIPIPQPGEGSYRGIASNMAAQLLEVAAHRDALYETCLLLSAQVKALRDTYEPKDEAKPARREPTSPTAAVVPIEPEKAYSLPTAEDLISARNGEGVV